MRLLTRFLAVVLAVAFVAAAVVAAFLYPIGTKLLAAQTYKDVIHHEQVAERLPEIAAEAIDQSLKRAGPAAAAAPAGTGGDIGALLGGFARSDLRVLLGAALPADPVRGQIDSLLDQFFGYVNGDAAKPSLTLSLVDLKQRLSGGALEEAYVKVLQDKPPCAGGSMELPTTCRPPAEQLPEVRARFRELIRPAVEAMPDQVDLFAARAGTAPESVYAAVGEVRLRLRFMAELARWSWGVPAALLVGVAVFAVRSVRGLLLWWGLPSLIAGGIGAFAAWSSSSLGILLFRWVIVPSLPAQMEVPVLAGDTVLAVVGSIARVVLGAALEISLALAIGGLVAVVLARFFAAKPAAPVDVRRPAA